MLIGRKKEIEILRRCYESDKSEFVAVYGRRRVGKTFLIKEMFESEFTFYSTGILNGDRAAQLNAWNNEISRFGMHNYAGAKNYSGAKNYTGAMNYSEAKSFAAAKNWFEAFENLNMLVEKSAETNENPDKKVIFLDEIPWMATMHSDFTTGLDYFWNRWASARKDVLLIICGSAASWITDNIINDKGGLHNRLTRQILLEPFTLHECEQFFEYLRLPMTRYQMAEAYMIFGGIPYYLNLMEPQYSLYQNVDEMYFSQGAELQNEFVNLYRSLYKNSEIYIRVIEALAKKGIGVTRNEIISDLKITDGGNLSKILRDLAISGFIREYKSFGQKKRDSLYQLIDFFSLFDIRFRDMRGGHSGDFWLRYASTQAYHAWSGVSYEKLCMMHLPQIRKRLGISGVLTSVYSWRGGNESKNVSAHESKGTQIDLIIDRNDNIINLCEIEFSSRPYIIDKKFIESLRNKLAAFEYSTRTRKVVQITMITTFGLIKNEYSSEIVSEVVLDDLFE